MPTQKDIYKLLAKGKAIENGFNPEVFSRQINQESGFNPKALSPKGAKGIAQIMPDTAKGWKVDPSNPEAALGAAAKNMAGYFRTYKGQGLDDKEATRRALAAYNAGPGAVSKHKGVPPYKETQDYVSKILGQAKPRLEKAAKRLGMSVADLTAGTDLSTLPSQKPGYKSTTEKIDLSVLPSQKKSYKPSLVTPGQDEYGKTGSFSTGRLLGRTAEAGGAVLGEIGKFVGGIPGQVQKLGEDISKIQSTPSKPMSKEEFTKAQLQLANTLPTRLGAAQGAANTPVNTLETLLNIPGMIYNVGTGEDKVKATQLPKVDIPGADKSTEGIGELAAQVLPGLGVSKLLKGASLLLKVLGTAATEGTVGALSGKPEGNLQQQYQQKLGQGLLYGGTAGALEGVLGRLAKGEKITSPAIQKEIDAALNATPQTAVDVVQRGAKSARESADVFNQNFKQLGQTKKLLTESAQMVKQTEKEIKSITGETGVQGQRKLGQSINKLESEAASIQDTIHITPDRKQLGQLSQDMADKLAEANKQRKLLDDLQTGQKLTTETKTAIEQPAYTPRKTLGQVEHTPNVLDYETKQILEKEMSPEAADSILFHEKEPGKGIELLSKKDSMMASTKTLMPSSFADIERVPGRLANLSRNFAVGKVAKDEVISTANKWADKLKIDTAKALGVSVRTFQKEILDKGILYQLDKYGVAPGLKPGQSAILSNFVKHLDDYNKDIVHPMLADLGYTATEVGKRSDAQTGAIAASINHGMLTATERTQLENAINSGVTVASSPIKKQSGLDLSQFTSFTNSKGEFFDKLKNGKDVYTKEGFGFIYDKSGNVRKDLFNFQANKRAIAFDSQFAEKLTQQQANAIRSEARASGVSTAQVDDVLEGRVRPTQNQHYKKFVASLNREEGRLLFKDLDPAEKLRKQTISLAKAIHDTPVVNEIHDVRKYLNEISELPEILSSPEKLGKINSEKILMNDFEAYIRRTPAPLDKWIGETLNSAVPQFDKDYILRNLRSWGDHYSWFETVMKLGLNAAASMMNIFEPIRMVSAKMLSEPGSFVKLAENIGKNPYGFVADTWKEMGKHPQSFALLQQKAYDLDRGFVSSASRFGTVKRLGSNVGNLTMKMFDASVKGQVAIAYRMLESVADARKLKGSAKDKFIFDQLRINKALPDIDLLLLSDRTGFLGKPAFLFKKFLIGLADTEAELIQKTFKGGRVDKSKLKPFINLLGFTAAPVALAGAGASPTLQLANDITKMITGQISMLTGGRGEPVDFLGNFRAEQNRPKDNPDAVGYAQGVLGRGFIGQHTAVDTSKLTANISSYFDGNYLPFDTGQKMAEMVLHNWNAVMDAQQSQKPFETWLDETKDNTLGAFRDTNTFVNRAVKAKEVTEGQYRTRQGTPINDEPIPENIRGISAAATLGGFEPAPVKEHKQRVQLGKQTEESRKLQIQDFADRAAAAYERGDTNRVQEIAKQAAEKLKTNISQSIKNRIVERRIPVDTQQKKRLGRAGIAYQQSR